MTPQTVLEEIAEQPATVPLKRLAWAFGCARKGSADERLLEQALRDRIIADQPQREGLVDGLAEVVGDAIGKLAHGSHGDVLPLDAPPATKEKS